MFSFWNKRGAIMTCMSCGLLFSSKKKLSICTCSFFLYITHFILLTVYLEKVCYSSHIVRYRSGFLYHKRKVQRVSLSVSVICLGAKRLHNYWCLAVYQGHLWDMKCELITPLRHRQDKGWEAGRKDLLNYPGINHYIVIDKNNTRAHTQDLDKEYLV